MDCWYGLQLLHLGIISIIIIIRFRVPGYRGIFLQIVCELDRQSELIYES